MKTNNDKELVFILNEMYNGEWVVNIVDGYLPQGKHIAIHHGYKLIVGEHIAEVDEGIRGKKTLNARIDGSKVFLSYIQ